MGQEALSTLYEIQPGARYVVEHAAGYGVFSTFGLKIFFAGGGTGKGFVHNNRTKRYTYMRMVQVQGGLGFGAKAQAAAMIQDTGGMFSGAVSVAPGVYIYRLTETGLAAELTVSGTKYFKDDEMN